MQVAYMYIEFRDDCVYIILFNDFSFDYHPLKLVDQTALALNLTRSLLQTEHCLTVLLLFFFFFGLDQINATLDVHCMICKSSKCNGKLKFFKSVVKLIVYTNNSLNPKFEFPHPPTNIYL